MSKFDKELWRLARTVHGQIVPRGGADDVALPKGDWQLLQKLTRQIRLARERGWHLASDQILRELASATDTFRRRLSDLRQTLSQAPSAVGLASEADVYRDLVSLRDELEDVSGDWNESELCVTTAPIVLDDVHLGPFQIRLKWTSLNHSGAYRVVALEPYPAQSNSDVTHPHVNDEQVCEGDGSAAIHAALASGRIGDFFLLVSQLLHTYARGSAFVELCDWRGSPCGECGAGVDDDNRCYCQRCDEMVCDDCINFCAGCEESYCTGCLSTCISCDSRFCPDCLGLCKACKAEICESCSIENHCPGCQKVEPDDEQARQANESIEVSGASTAGITVQSDCLGETPVSA